METVIYDLELVFKTELLGSCPQKQIVEEFLQSKREFELEADEVKALEYGEQLEKATTFFYRHPEETDVLVLKDHQVKGFLKKVGQTFNGKAGMPAALRNKIMTTVFVCPRWIPILDAGTPDFLERPLRAETVQGPRTALARSEMLLPGCRVHCELHVKPGAISEKVLRALLEEGQYWGIGQWHNGGYGLFDYTLTKRD
jgi:hypothetical protein